MNPLNSVTFYTRSNLNQPLPLSGWRVAVKSMSWDVEGGPQRAVLLLQPLSPRYLSGLQRLLRCGVKISSRRGGSCWWGYVHAIRFSRTVLSLDTLANRISVRYREDMPGENPGFQSRTAWLSDARSSSFWGIKERILSLGTGSAAAAQLLAEQTLAQTRQPRYTLPAHNLTSAPLELELRGYWETLAWQHFAEPRGLLGFSGGGSAQTVGEPNSVGVGQRFTVGAAGWEASTIWVKAGKIGAPSDALRLSIRAQSGSLPSAVDLVAVNLPAATIDEGITWRKVSLPTPLMLNPNTVYWLYLQRSGTVTNTDYYRISVDGSLPYPQGVMRGWTPTTGWFVRSPDAEMPFYISGEQELGTQIRNVIGACAPFLNGVMLRAPATQRASQYRAGNASAREELNALLRQAALQAHVLEDRTLVAEPLPAEPAQAPLRIRPDGVVTLRNGMPTWEGMRVCGQWAKLDGQEIAGEAGPGDRIFIRHATWENGQIRATG